MTVKLGLRCISARHRVLIISNDQYNGVDGLPIWALPVVREAPQSNSLAVRLDEFGTFVRIHSLVQILDRTALRESHGFVSHATMAAVELALREFLELP